MIIVLKPHPTPEVVQHVLERIEDLGLTPHLSQGVSRTIIGVLPPKFHLPATWEGMDQKKPELWAAAVELYGIIDWYTMLKHEDPFLQEYEKSILGDPEKDRAVYENASPIKFIRNATAPLLVLHPGGDGHSGGDRRP